MTETKQPISLVGLLKGIKSFGNIQIICATYSAEKPVSFEQAFADLTSVLQAESVELAGKKNYTATKVKAETIPEHIPKEGCAYDIGEVSLAGMRFADFLDIRLPQTIYLRNADDSLKQYLQETGWTVKEV